MQTNKNLLPQKFVKMFVNIALLLKESMILFKGKKSNFIKQN